MKLFFLLTLVASASAFVVPQNNAVQKTNLAATSSDMEEESNSVSRRDMLFTGLATSLLFVPTTASAEDASAIKNVFVSGATGQTGSRCFNKLLADKSVSVVGGVRNVAKASKSLGANVSLKHLDVVEDSVDALASTLEGVDGLIIASGFNPGKNLLRMAAAAHEVDNVGTCKLIDAAKKAGVKKVVLVSSILTNGRAWGQEESPGFKITNAFGNSLDEKLESELYLRKSGLDYTIVRPGGLQAKAPVGELLISGEDTLNSGEISRDLVADVCIASLTDPKATKKVLEIIEDEGKPPKVFNGLVM
ncbi:hypothetical protein CTEN210_06112 [Chaetoceros tenuissimus]|uniref:NAD(P)-binding domain-containing protein n=1 Tax=Chaetoceros tenuissimus TaxID=426638 RepID=A0AAD3H449_9STRA|nr:hypothetical protein CTEN210_06112 [Chaetoceros tenuissimus]